jgi:ABC-type lipopolysaccharide export system ATPase subunit
MYWRTKGSARQKVAEFYVPFQSLSAYTKHIGGQKVSLACQQNGIAGIYVTDDNFSETLHIIRKIYRC